VNLATFHAAEEKVQVQPKSVSFRSRLLRLTHRNPLTSLMPRGGLEPPCGCPRWILSSFQARSTCPQLSQPVRIFNGFSQRRFSEGDDFVHHWSPIESKLSQSRLLVSFASRR
jgi:hypothetical protein